MSSIEAQSWIYQSLQSQQFHFDKLQSLGESKGGCIAVVPHKQLLARAVQPVPRNVEGGREIKHFVFARKDECTCNESSALPRIYAPSARNVSERFAGGWSVHLCCLSILSWNRTSTPAKSARKPCEFVFCLCPNKPCANHLVGQYCVVLRHKSMHAHAGGDARCCRNTARGYLPNLSTMLRLKNCSSLLQRALTLHASKHQRSDLPVRPMVHACNSLSLKGKVGRSNALKPRTSIVPRDTAHITPAVNSPLGPKCPLQKHVDHSDEIALNI